MSEALPAPTRLIFTFSLWRLIWTSEHAKDGDDFVPFHGGEV